MLLNQQANAHSCEKPGTSALHFSGFKSYPTPPAPTATILGHSCDSLSFPSPPLQSRELSHSLSSGLAPFPGYVTRHHPVPPRRPLRTCPICAPTPSPQPASSSGLALSHLTFPSFPSQPPALVSKVFLKHSRSRELHAVVSTALGEHLGSQELHVHAPLDVFSLPLICFPHTGSSAPRFPRLPPGCCLLGLSPELQPGLLHTLPWPCELSTFSQTRSSSVLCTIH